MLPERFIERMKPLLGDELETFLSALEEERVRAFRENPIKCDGRAKELLCDFSPEKITYTKDGYLYRGEGIGNTPLHHAGGIYCQDPGAMSALSSLEIEKGWRVLDACAAPGGKSAQAAAAIGESGFLLANEFVGARAKITVGNFERLGLTQAMVTSLPTDELSRLFSGYFDLVICDAPCSGEGMFRKYDEALTEWSEENIRLSAARQSEILNNVASCVKDGGYLLYSTCTFAIEENEEQIARFLASHPDFSLLPVKDEVVRVTADGIAPYEVLYELGSDIAPEKFKKCRRFYPHRTPGEGQFVALLQRSDPDILPTILYKDASKPLNREQEKVMRAFLNDNLDGLPELCIRAEGERIVAVAASMPVPPRSVFSAGVLIGEIKKGNFFPHHQLFSAYGKYFKRKVDLKKNDRRVEQYLHGEEIDTDEKNGWCALLYEGIPLGGGKISGGKVKNHYPKGLRTKK